MSIGNHRFRTAHNTVARVALAGALWAAVLTSVVPAPVRAHEIPTDITIYAFVKPEGGTLRLLLRIPLRAMRDIEFPLRDPGYLEIAQADSSLRHAAILWLRDDIQVFEDGMRLATPELIAARASIPSDRSFVAYEDALAHVLSPRLPDATALYWDQALLDVLFEYPIESDESDFSLRPNLDRLALRVGTVLRFLPPSGVERAYQYAGHPGLIRLDPRWYHAALRFVALGFTHILDGIDHLLFLLCLVIPFRRIRPLIAIITAFTVAHSITLIGSALGLAPNTLWFPPLVETLIAASIVYMALENIVGANVRRRWAVAFGFGLVHGFGFSFALRETMQFAGAHLATSLFAFNVGIELGQLLVVALLVPALGFVFRSVVQERLGTIILSALVAHTGWHWMTERGAALAQYDFQLPAADAAFFARALGVTAGLAALGAGAWWISRAARNGWPRRRATESGATAGAQD